MCFYLKFYLTSGDHPGVGICVICSVDSMVLETVGKGNWKSVWCCWVQAVAWEIAVASPDTGQRTNFLYGGFYSLNTICPPTDLYTECFMVLFSEWLKL